MAPLDFAQLITFCSKKGYDFFEYPNDSSVRETWDQYIVISTPNYHAFIEHSFDWYEDYGDDEQDIVRKHLSAPYQYVIEFRHATLLKEILENITSQSLWIHVNNVVEPMVFIPLTQYLAAFDEWHKDLLFSN
jgi:hypothetical protein